MYGIIKPFTQLTLTDKPSAQQITNMLLSSAGLPHPLYHPLALYSYFTIRQPKLANSVLANLGLLAFQGTKAELLALLYMITAVNHWNSKLADQTCKLNKQQLLNKLPEKVYNQDQTKWLYPCSILFVVTGKLVYLGNVKVNNNETAIKLVKRERAIHKYQDYQITLLSEFYSDSYDSVNRIRVLKLIHPYTVTLYGILLNNLEDFDRSEDYVLDWAKQPEKIIRELDMLPCEIIPRVDYSWNAFQYYHLVINRQQYSEDNLEALTDRELVSYLERHHPELHIRFRTRAELLELALNS